MGNHETLYGIPEKLIRLVKVYVLRQRMYDIKTSSGTSGKTWLQHVWFIFFHKENDWVMRKSTTENNTEIR